MFTLPPAYLPVHQDSPGQLRVAGTRVTLDTVVHAHLGGASAEVIVRRYPSLPLAAVYATVGYYLYHRAEFDRYLATRQEAAEVRRLVTARQGPQDGIRARLLARLAAPPGRPAVVQCRRPPGGPAMSVTIRDVATAAELTANPGSVEVFGPDGRLLGRFVPHIEFKLSDHEVTERANRPDAKWYTPEQVMDRLREIDERG